ncbi:MAG: hypothetical protein KGR26_07870 [Cyanobacteria bacterium REEB65]|nr:hypothetical protein [Cyanobacteria bacterium REEB65]
MAGVRKQIYIRPQQEAELKRIARERGLSEAEIIRSCLDRGLSLNLQVSASPPVINPDAWSRVCRFVEERSGLPVSPGQRTWRRDDLYDLT